MRITRLLLLLFFALTIGSYFLAGCYSNQKNENKKLEGSLEHGQKLANYYCKSCHLPVDPALLDKNTWKERVLPAMAKRLGLEVYQNNQYYQNQQSAISHGDWMEIVAYYDSLAPEKLSAGKTVLRPTSDMTLFELKKPLPIPTETATTTLVYIDKKNNGIVTGEGDNASLSVWNRALKQTFAVQLPSPAVGIIKHEPDRYVATCIGDMKAVDIPAGEIVELGLIKGATHKSITKNLIRPVQTVGADFNKDGLTDYVICSFGHDKGGLFWSKQLQDKNFQTIPIREIPGATQAITGDFNNDGWVDIMALFAHGDEGIWLFLNDMKGGFSEKNILRFPPVYGSSSFQLVDIDKDGKRDIIYTAGDNSDYSRILKPYHGLYIFSNSSSHDDFSSFKQSYFFPINGATKAIATDFDQDGDYDIAVIAFFADLKNNPAETFTYFEKVKTAGLKEPDFKQHSFPINKNGRWICMDVNDYDGDGDADIVMGNYSKGFINEDDFTPDWDLNVPFVILENKTKDASK